MNSISLEPGHDAPDFSAVALGGPYGAGTTVSLSDFRGQTVVLYFYPKDATPGCTRQACALRDRWPEIQSRAVVFGVSTDPARSHLRFIEKNSLPFPLLADEEHVLVNAYGVWVEKVLYGRHYHGTERTSFVIGPDGRLQAVLRKVKPALHFDQLLAVL